MALLTAALAAAIIVIYLVMRPPLTRNVKLWLLFGLGILPIGSAVAANIQGFKATQERQFCGSCHVMTPYLRDVEDPASLGLASRHGRNKYFGGKNCYTCHADYGMYGTVLTKIGGMRHVWFYYKDFYDMPLDEAREKIHLVKPYPNQNCMECHSTKLAGWLSAPDHRSALPALERGAISCASPGCHGYAHPWSKRDADVAPAQLTVDKRVRAIAHDRDAGADSGAREAGSP